VALALPALDPEGELLTTSLSELAANLERDVLPTACTRALVALPPDRAALVLAARENAAATAAVPPSYDERLQRACDFALHCSDPTDRSRALGRRRRQLRGAADAGGGPARPARPRVRRHARDARPAPRERGASFPQGGYEVQRSGWGEGSRAYRDERYLILDCGPWRRRPRHYDLLAGAFAAGRRWWSIRAASPTPRPAR